MSLLLHSRQRAVLLAAAAAVVLLRLCPEGVRCKPPLQRAPNH